MHLEAPVPDLLRIVASPQQMHGRRYKLMLHICCMHACSKFYSGCTCAYVRMPQTSYQVPRALTGHYTSWFCTCVVQPTQQHLQGMEESGKRLPFAVETARPLPRRTVLTKAKLTDPAPLNDVHTGLTAAGMLTGHRKSICLLWAVGRE